MTSNIEIRALKQEDWDIFHQLDLATTWESIPEKDRQLCDRSKLQDSIEAVNRDLLSNPDHSIFIAEVAPGVPAGIIWLGEKVSSLTGDREAWVYNLSILPRFRKRGIGKALLAHAEKWALSRGYQSIGLMVASHNMVARKLYETFAFSSDYIIMRRRVA